MPLAALSNGVKRPDLHRPMRAVAIASTVKEFAIETCDGTAKAALRIKIPATNQPSKPTMKSPKQAIDRRHALMSKPRHPDAFSPAPSVDWEAIRTPSRESDLVLSPAARAWCNSLPAAHLPHRLCQLYPRVANRIALCWPERALTELLFIDLLMDKRGHRNGFPAQVAKELTRLHHLNLARPAGVQKDDKHNSWASHMQVPTDR